MNRARVKTKVLANAMIIVTLFSTLLISRASATSEWSKPRPSKYRVFDETIGNANTDGIASVTMGVTIGEYVENSPSHDYNDYLGLKISVSANTRKGIEYETSGESFYWYSVSNPTGIDADNGGVWLDLYDCAPTVGPILFYGVKYHKIWVCSNGFISFDSECTNPTPPSIPNPDKPNTIIAPFWRDLKPNLWGSIKYGVVMDVNGYDRFVISWEDVPDAEGNLQKFQLSIRVTYGACAEWHNNIYFTYESITKTCATTVGVEDQTGYQGTSIDYSQLSNNSCTQVYYSHGCKLDRLIIRLTKSDSDALIDFIPNYIVGYNVVLQDYSNPCGDLFVSAISYGVSLIPIIGTMYETLLIVTETAYVLSGNLSPGDPQVVNAGSSDTEAFINAPCFNEEGGWRPYDSTLATTVEWSFTDPNDKSHSMTITAEALYQDLYDGSYHTVPTSVTLNMYTGCHYVDIDTKIDGSETTGVKVWIDDAEYSSPVLRMPPEGTHTIEVESPIYRDSVKYKFQTWSDGIDENPRTIGLYSDLNVSTLYKAVYCLEILVPSVGGTTVPSPETYEYPDGTILNVTALPDEGFSLNCWNLDGIFHFENPITVTMNSDHTLKAYFHNATGSGGNPEPCPTLYVWNGSAWIDYGVIDIHNPTGEDVIREVPVQTEDVGINNRKATFRLREGWEGLNLSESVIDQVKLYAINEDGKLKLCPLASAEHSRFGDVREYVASSDDVKVQMLLLETIDLTFKVPEDSQGFVFVIEGCNMLKL